MKRQNITPINLTSRASNSNIKGLQQYFTPEPWAKALSAALPSLRRTVVDLHCGDGSLLRGCSNPTTREACGLDLDPTATTGTPKAWEASRPMLEPPMRSMIHGDVLDFYPLALELDARFDLIVCNPPFSLRWPAHETLAQGLLSKSIDSTHATLRMLPRLLSDAGEGMIIANQNSLSILRDKHPEDFDKAWLWISLPSFFPGVANRIGVIYLAADHSGGTSHRELGPTDPQSLATLLDNIRQASFTATCIHHPWELTRAPLRTFSIIGDEMERRRNPAATQDNVTLDADGLIRVWISAFQENSLQIDHRLVNHLRSIHRKHPLSLTLQRASRMALQEMLDCGAWTISPAAEAAIRQAVNSFNRDRAPLSPVSAIQKIGWIDDAEHLKCRKDFLHFRAGRHYKLSTQTIQWRKQENRPRYHAGKRELETVTVAGTDLKLTLHDDTHPPVSFIYNPETAGTIHPTFSLEELAEHFVMPEVPDITALHPEEYAHNLQLLDELESLTP